MIQWDDNARLDVACPVCSKTTNVRFGDLSTGTAKCSHCTAVFDGREIKRQVEEAFRNAGF